MVHKGEESGLWLSLRCEFDNKSWRVCGLFGETPRVGSR